MLIIVAALRVSVAGYAQEKGSMAAGANLNLGFAYDGDYNNVGIGFKYQYSVTDQIRIEPEFTYFFKKDYVSMWDLMVNAHYIFKVADNKVNLYPIVGLGVLGTKASYYGYSSSDTDLGVNLSGGAEYRLTPNIIVGAELKYQLASDWDHLGLQVGVTYSF